jgi:adenylate kinase family enzyme
MHNNIFFIIGSSGSGKTTIVELIRDMKIPNLVVCRSDSMKVPTTEEIIKKYGSMEKWQEINTSNWVKNIKEKYLSNCSVVFDIQSRPSFIDEACKNNNIRNYKIILFDCSDEERKRRLIKERKQPHLANDQMMDWARYLREKCAEHCCIIDNTNLTIIENVNKLLIIIND